MRLKCLAIISIGALAVTAAINQPAQSDPLYDVGGSMTVSGTNAPNSYFETSTLQLGAATGIDSGALNLTPSIVDAADGAEWLILHWSTSEGAAIVGNTNSSWQTQAVVPFLVPANALGYYLDWSSNGTLLTPTAPFGSAVPGTNPVTGVGTVLVNSTFCPYTNCNYITPGTNTVTFFANTGDYATAPGNSGSAFLTANDFELGIELAPVTPTTPLPAALPLFATGIGAMGFVGWRRKRKAQAAA
jgi:hypothetical protein